MLRNYIKIAFRTLLRQAGYACINIFGLAVGIACFLLIAGYLQHEFSFDTYHEKGDRIYRLLSYGGYGEKYWNTYVSGDPIPEMRKEYPDVEDATKYMNCGTDRIQREGEVFRDIKMLCAESNLFNIFSFDLVQGDPTSILDRPNTAVITHSLARRLFGDGDPVGKTLPIHFSEEERLFEIAGLMADVPATTHFTFDLLLSYASLNDTRRCLTCGQPMYALLAPGADPEAVAGRVLTLIRDTQGKEYVDDIRLEPLRDIHFSEVMAERQGDIRYVYLLSGIALVLLLIACANYMNLATARAIRRTREVGVRKAIGAKRGQLIRQFLAETLLLTVLALPLALLLLVAALPAFNTLAGAEVTLAWRENLGFLGVVVGTIVLVGLLAGSYPALFLSRFQPVEVLRGRLPSGFSGAALRRVLVVFQFAASIMLLIATTVILRQLDYMQQKKLGFDAEQVVLVNVTDPVLAQQPERLKQEFLRHVDVVNATAGWGVPGQIQFPNSLDALEPFGGDGPPVTLFTPPIDLDFLETMRIPLLAGRNISTHQRIWQDGIFEREVIVNEAAVEAMKWGSPDEALGKQNEWRVVVGVVPDFNFQSLHQEVVPLMMMYHRFDQATIVALRLAGGNVHNTLAGLEQTWQGLGTTMPFEFSFLTDELNQLYEREQRAARIFGIFAGLAILVACLGLFGLAAFAAEQRTKEIGIRKVLGATVRHVVLLLSKDFIGLVLVAFVVAVPIAYVAMHRWLEDFAYRIEISGWIFLIVGSLALAVAMLTVSYQAVRAALANPVDSLRYE